MPNRQDEDIAKVDPFRSPNAIQLLATLNRIEPTIWRRLVVPWTWHLGQLHLTIQAAFGWCDSHLHEFRIGGVAYGDPENNEWNDDTSVRTFDETELRLLDFAREPGRSFDYVYDFDNMRTAVDRVGTGKIRQVNARFAAMASHYLFEPTFCSPASGWAWAAERTKGQVEKNVQDARRQIWQVMPGVADMPSLNA